MEERHKQLLRQCAEMAEEGKFGEEIQAARREYGELPVGVATLLKCVVEAYGPKSSVTHEMLQLRDLFCQLLIATYRDAARSNSEVALALVHSLIQDFPGVSESCLLPQFCSLMQAALGSRDLAHSTNRLLVWQQMSRLFLAYNEFLNALLSFVIPCVICARGKSPDVAVFSQPYGAKLQQLTTLTGGENGAFYLISRIARPHIRNAIAHGAAWLDSDAAKVRYSGGRSQKQEGEIDLLEFGALAMAGSHLGEPYLAAIGTIAVMEDGSDLAKALLPPHLVRVFQFEGGDIGIKRKISKK